MNDNFYNNKKRKYDRIHWEIVGKCNAKCKYCLTGRGSHPIGGFIDVNKFAKAMDILIKNELINSSACFHLYVWGEPTLHPKLDKIINIIQNHDKHYYLSTNCGHEIVYQKNWFNNLDGITVSMCGFSQESYDRIHKLNFEQVKKNIINLVDSARKSEYDTKKIRLSHHIYQFNVEEIPLLFEFTNKLNIEYHPYYACIGDLDITHRYLHGMLTQQEWLEISQDIFGHYLMKRAKLHPKNGCRQFERLVLDEECNVLTCCCLPRNHSSYTFTNVFNQSFIEKLSDWEPNNNCYDCIKNCLSPFVENGNSFKFDISRWFTEDCAWIFNEASCIIGDAQNKLTLERTLE